MVISHLCGSNSALSSGRVFGIRPKTPNQRRVVPCAASQRNPRKENVEGQFYVDHTCIDCDTCRWMAEGVFERVGSQSAVTTQPTSRQERVQALGALLACPSSSIHALDKDPSELHEARDAFPMAIDGCPGVFHCGYHSEKSFGGISYFVQREAGNIMFDSPRFNPVLAKQLEDLGGVQHIVLSHIDDVADHEKWAKYFGAPRIMHKAEIWSGIDDVEIQLTGGGPWNLKGDTIGEADLDDGVQVLHVPGHTAGCIALWHRNSQTILSGDHLGYSMTTGAPSIFERFNRDGVEKQLQSVQKLLDYDFLNVLPGHGRFIRVEGDAERRAMVDSILQSYGQVS